MYIVESSRIKSGKRFMAIFHNGKTIHFGRYGGETYIDHGDKDKRTNYIKRHQKRENWNTPYTAGSLSRWITWGDSTDINENIRAFKKRFNIV